MTNPVTPLLPCPFCAQNGGKHFWARGEAHWIECTLCDSAGRTCLTQAEAVAAWNRRPIEDGLREALTNHRTLLRSHCGPDDAIWQAADAEADRALPPTSADKGT